LWSHRFWAAISHETACNAISRGAGPIMPFVIIRRRRSFVFARTDRALRTLQGKNSKPVKRPAHLPAAGVENISLVTEEYFLLDNL